jgi:hypothetical protein
MFLFYLVRWDRNSTKCLLEIRTCFKLVSCLAYSSTLKTEATFSSETSADFQWTSWRYIPEDRTIHNYRCETLKSYSSVFVWMIAGSIESAVDDSK